MNKNVIITRHAFQRIHGRGADINLVRDIVTHQVPAVYIPSVQQTNVSIGVGNDGKYWAVVFREENWKVITVRNANKTEVKIYDAKYSRPRN
ncbi:hypothetical protein AGMMS49938_06680 [Fibrobacterales bacterium]|nr:hypothetical protein AGMMS49938_06680 [Fibrobacterales bacterium]